VTTIGGEDEICCAIVETQETHELQKSFLDLDRKLIRFPLIDESKTVTAPIDAGFLGTLGIDGSGEHPVSDDCGPELQGLGNLFLKNGWAVTEIGEVFEVAGLDSVGKDHLLFASFIDGERGQRFHHDSLAAFACQQTYLLWLIGDHGAWNLQSDLSGDLQLELLVFGAAQTVDRIEMKGVEAGNHPVDGGS
jgi:hypothetical protein